MVWLDLLCPRSHRVGALCIHGRHLSLCLSVPCLTLSREWKSVGSWKLAGKKLMMSWVTHDSIERSNGQRSRSLVRLMLWPKISHIFETGRPKNLRLGIQMECNDLHYRRFLLCFQTESSGWLFMSSLAAGIISSLLLYSRLLTSFLCLRPSLSSAARLSAT